MIIKQSKSLRCPNCFEKLKEKNINIDNSFFLKRIGYNIKSIYRTIYLKYNPKSINYFKNNKHFFYNKEAYKNFTIKLNRVYYICFKCNYYYNNYSFELIDILKDKRWKK